MKPPGVKTYVQATGTLFSLVVLAHVVRLAEEGIGVMLSPLFGLTSLVCLVIGAWALWLLKKGL